jgi:hypothetical protein
MFKVRDLLCVGVCRVSGWCHMVSDLLDEPLNQRIEEHY